MADERAAGNYEPAADLTGIIAEYHFIGRWLAASARIECAGRFGRPTRLVFADLVEMARILPSGAVVVAFVDLFAQLELDGSADVIMIEDDMRGEVAVPVSELVDGGRLLIGTTRRPLLATAGVPYRLETEGFSSEADPDPVTPLSMRALTFAEFVTCQ